MQTQIVRCVHLRGQEHCVRTLCLIVLVADRGRRPCVIVKSTAASEKQPTGVTIAEVTLTKSVLHRPGPEAADSQGPCTSDCNRLT
jgi:hypothetical protein